MQPGKMLAPAARISVTVLLLWFVFRSIDLEQLRSHLARLDKGLLLALISAAWAGQLLCTQRWRVFALSLGFRGSYWDYLKLYFAGMFFNLGLPSLIGGDAVKAYVISRRSTKSFPLGLASVLQDRAAGLVALLAYGTAAAALAGLSWRGIPIILGYLTAWFWLAGLAIVVWKGERLIRTLLGSGAPRPVRRLAEIASELHQALRLTRMPARHAFQAAGISLLNSALVLWIFEQVTVAAGRPVGQVDFAALFPLIGLLTMLPISLGGLGIREWGYVEGLALVGVPRDQALLIALSTSAIIIVINLAGLLFLPAIPATLRRGVR